MPPKLLVITDAATTRAGWVLTTLRLLGFDAQRAYTYQSGSEIRLTLPDAEYRLDIDDASLRTRLRQYNAVLIMHGFDRYTFANIPVAYTWRFLNWNASDDPPFIFLGLHFATNRTAVPLPGDFPLVRPDRANLASTAHRLDPTDANIAVSTYRVHLTRETAQLYIPVECDLESGDAYYAWRLDATKHAALGNAGEVLAELIGEDYMFNAIPIVAYRYRNCFLLPRLNGLVSAAVTLGPGVGRGGWHAFWLLYALKCVRLTPRYQLPVQMQVDDLQEIGGTPAPRYTSGPFVHSWLRSHLETYRWYANEFFVRTEIPLWAALTTGGRHGLLNSAWHLFINGRRRVAGGSDEPIDSGASALAQQMLQLFQREQNRSMRFCFHDHRTNLADARTMTRHTDAGYPLAAPNDVPVAHGQIVRKANIAPPANAVEIEIDGEVYYDINPQRTGTATDVWYTPNLHAARILVERNLAEMRALGFADGGIGGDGRFHISANGHYGSPAVVQALYESGVRIFRTNLPAHTFELAQTRLFARVRGVWLYGSWQIDAYNTDAAWEHTNTGLYDSVHPERSFIGGVSGMNPQNDVTSIWTTEPTRAYRRAYRRLIGYYTYTNLLAIVYPWFMTFHHPAACQGWCDPADPLRRFDAEASVPSGSPGPHLNVLLEFWLNFEVVYRVLRDYLTPATGANVIATRERWVES